MKHMNTQAVSPVVGVMLMLVVTIIIAAIVSAFAGGISGNSAKTPNAQITAYYSQSQGMWIENDGPDDLSTVDTNIYVRCSDSFGNAQHIAWAVNKSTLSQYNVTGQPLYSASTGGDFWLTGGGSTGIKTFKAGDRAYLYPPYHTSAYMQPDLTMTTYKFDNSKNLGNSFYVELTDKNGKSIAKTFVKIQG
jgi:archaeal type IV pilus assembly protein PilA